jgi:hypothetical protein
MTNTSVVSLNFENVHELENRAGGQSSCWTLNFNSDVKKQEQE